MKLPSLTATPESGVGPSGLQTCKQALRTGMGMGLWGTLALSHVAGRDQASLRSGPAGLLLPPQALVAPGTHL